MMPRSRQHKSSCSTQCRVSTASTPHSEQSMVQERPISCLKNGAKVTACRREASLRGTLAGRRKARSGSTSCLSVPSGTSRDHCWWDRGTTRSGRKALLSPRDRNMSIAGPAVYAAAVRRPRWPAYHYDQGLVGKRYCDLLVPAALPRA